MARPKYPSDKQDQFMVRLPEGMRDRIADAADRNGRSMNAEIVARLEWTFGPADEEMLALHKRIEGIERERDEAVYNLQFKERELQFTQKDLQTRREQLQDEAMEIAALRADLAKEAGRSDAFRSAIEILARHVKEGSDCADFSIEQIFDAIQKPKMGGE
ncbi:hypothetical protein VP03_12190 [Sinorhizobium meliloti]|uniref:Arc family DNA-binding protein n=1 Tax=Rhizobium meliloti TaxID=382 RepID=UPI0006147EDA|nr:Arc family DNA-binding protein [Sinorhizobium meliloti]KKA13694.1 hypothetical protein VP03_12190 [Sinorhizobium meliloti]